MADVKKVMDSTAFALAWAKAKEYFAKAGEVIKGVQVDGRAVSPTNGIVNIEKMTGATDTAAGTSGIVPAPKASEAGAYLKGDGTWSVPNNTDEAEVKSIVESYGYLNAQGVDSAITAKGYTTMKDVEAKGYTTMSTVEAKGYTTMKDVEAKNYTTLDTVKNQGYVTDAEVVAKGYVTSTQVQTAINDADHLKRSIVTSLPATGEDNIVYMVPRSGGSGTNVYDEYMYLNSKWEIIGGTEVDLSGYYNTTNLVPMDQTDIDKICV